MKVFARSILVAFAASSSCIHAAEGKREDVVIERGSARLTLADIDARMTRLASATRPDFAFRPENLARMMDQLLLNRQLANEAREAGLDANPDVRRDLELAMEEVLAIHRLNQVADERERGDLEKLARERYLADPSKFIVGEQRVVEHVLVRNDSRTDDEARTLAETVRAEAIRDGSSFPVLVERYSEDTGKAGNKGRYVVSKEGQYVPEFEAASRALKQPGDVSEPVKTTFGYHIIRLVEVRPESRRAFEDVKDQIVADVRENQLSTLREAHKKQLSSLPERGDDALLRSLPDRYHAGKAAVPPAVPGGQR